MKDNKKTFRKHQRADKLRGFHRYLLNMHILRDIMKDQFQNLLQVALETDQLVSIVNFKRKSQIIQAVPLRFSSVEHYNKLWESLFFEEAKSQIYRQLKENEKTIITADVASVVQATEDGQKIMNLTNAKGKNQEIFLPGNLVVVSPVQPKENQDYPHLIGILEKEGLSSIRVNLSEQYVKEKYPQDWKTICETKRWYIQLISSIHTLERQYFALISFEESLNDYLRQIFLHPQSELNNQKKFRIPTGLQIQLKKHFNQSQYKAIGECLKQSGVTLIQGPPGTGKTKTVLGTLSVLLGSFSKSIEQEQAPLLLSWKKSASVNRSDDSRLNPWLYSGYVDWRDEPLIDLQDDPLNLTSFYDKCEKTDKKIQLFKKGDDIILPGKVLICGPSNASVDQIIRKLLSQELFDGDGKKYLPNFVRVGQNYDPQLKQHSLDFIATKICKAKNSSDPREEYAKILNDYRLVFATLSAAGSPAIENSGVTFDTVVIDEAGQSIQISNLIPLMYGCQRLILIGDPNQLPATVFSQKSLEHNYDQSLFERLMKSGYPVNILKTQYRMHPEISSVVSKNFYSNQLTDWEGLKIPSPIGLPKSFIFFHLEQSAQISYKKSFRNEAQAKAIIDFVSHISKSYNDIGVVSPYSQQVSLIQSMMGSAKNKKCEVKTIDSFQGREKDVIIFSAVRSRFWQRNKTIEENKKKTIGFVGDTRRINVSLSRAKSLCIIFGDAKRLSINRNWKNIISQAEHNGQLFGYQISKSFHSQFKANPNNYLIKKITEQI